MSENRQPAAGIQPGARSAAKGKGKGKGKGGGPKKTRRVGLIWLFFVVLFAVVCAVVGYLLVVLNGERILSANINKLNLDTASVIQDREGNLISKLYVSEGNREFAPFNEIPPTVRDAFVATEDKRFYEHSGIDLMGIGRALVKDVIARSAVEGASTITQQLAKNLFLNADKTLFRKGTEASIALALENHKTKEEILELYLNRIYFGKGQYGIKTAAKYYFNKPLDKLKIWEIATLAGIPKAPSTYNPVSNPEKSAERRAVVLNLMQEQGLITEQEKAEAAKAVYKAPNTTKQGQKYLSYVDYVVDEAKERTGLTEEELLSAGYTITTTINTTAQTAMESAFANDKNFESVKDDEEQKVQGSMVIMDQYDGSLVAMVGGRDFESGGWNRVDKQRQPGSSFKPIVDYGAAIDTGNYFPWSIVKDEKHCFGKYCPSNSNRNPQYRGDIPMTQAIKESRNVSAVWLLNEIGIKTGMNFAEKLGITLDSTKDRNLAIALGGLTKGVSPIQMARAYGAFANGGKLQDAHSIISIKDSNGDSVYEYDDKSAKRVMSENTAYYVRELMKGVVQTGGTGVNAAISGRQVAGKTGTTQLGIEGVSESGKNRDVWFVGFTPEWTAAVWFGYDKTDKNHYLTKSSGQAAKMFSTVMSKALKGQSKKSFPVPEDIQKEDKLDKVSGFMASYSPEQVSVELSWTQAEGEGITYKVYRKESSETDFRFLGESAETYLEDMAILPDMTYEYYVTAYQAAKKLESDPSEHVSVTVTTGMETPPPDEGDDGGIFPPDEQPEETPTPGDGEEGGGEPTPTPTPDGGEESPTPTPTPTPTENPPPSPEA